MPTLLDSTKTFLISSCLLTLAGHCSLEENNVLSQLTSLQTIVLNSLWAPLVKRLDVDTIIRVHLLCKADLPLHLDMVGHTQSLVQFVALFQFKYRHTAEPKFKPVSK